MNSFAHAPAYRGRQNKNTAFTLTELAIVLAIIGVMAGTIWSYASRAWENYKVSTVVGQVMKSVDNIRDHYNGLSLWPAAWSAGTEETHTFDGLSLFPFEMRQSGSTNINHALNGAVTNGSFHVYTEQSPFGSNPLSTFRVALQGLNQSSCVKLLMGMPLTDGTIGIVRVGTPSNACAILNGVASSCSITLPMTSATALSWCSLTSNTNEIDLDFKIHN